MAVPTIVATTNPTWSTAGTPSPALPTGWAVGDVLVAAVFSRGSTTDPTIGLPTGWTDLAYSVGAETNTNGSFRAMAKVAQSGETAPTFVSNITATQPCGALLIALRGADLAAFVASTVYFTTGTAAGANPVTTVSADNLILMLGGLANDVIHPAITGYTSLLDGATITGQGTAQATSAGSDAAMLAVHATAATAGTYDPTDFTFGTAPNLYISCTVAVPPATAGTTVTLGQASEVDSATVLNPFGPKTIVVGQALEVDSATVLGGLDSFSTDFPGTALPAGWTFHSALGTGSVAVADSWATITMPGGTVQDGIRSLTSTDDTVGIKAPLLDHGGDLDIAVYLGTDITDRFGVGVNLHFQGAASTEAIRWSIYHSNTDADSEYAMVYGYARSGGASVTLNQQFDRYMTGLPAWLRVTYVASTGVWQFLHSSDGYVWDTDRSRDAGVQATTLTRSFTAQTVKVSLSTSGASPGGATMRVGKVIDLLARGTTDLRDAVQPYTPIPVSSFTGSAGALPSGWLDVSVGASNISWTGTALRLRDFGAVEFDRAAIRYSGTPFMDWGLLLKLSNPAGSTSYFFTSGMGSIEAATGDMYVGGPGYGLEVQQRGMIRRPIRIDSTADQTINPVAPYPTDLDETPYCHLKDIRDGYDLNLGGTRWFRIERTGPRIRYREWADGDIEPSTWNLYDGQDEVEYIPSLPFLSLSHNGVRTGSNDTDLTHVEFYRLVAGQVVSLGQATETDAAQSVRAGRRHVLNQAVETGSATPLQRRVTKALLRATELDVANSVGTVPVTLVTLGQAQDIMTAATVPLRKIRAVGQAADSVAAQALIVLKRAPLPTSTESDSSYGLSILGGVRVMVLLQALETDLARLLTPILPIVTPPVDPPVDPEPEVTTSYLFIPPTAPMRPATVRREHVAHSLFRHYRPWDAGTNVWLLADGTVTTVDPADPSVRVFHGGHLNTVTASEAAALVAAGYTVQEVTS